MRLPELVGRRLGSLFRRRVARRLSVLILRKESADPPAAPAGVHMVRHDEYDPAILDAYRLFGRTTTEERLRRRFQRGLRFCALHRTGVAVANLWIASEGERFVDELGQGFRVPDRAIWLRDVFVDKRARRQGLFSVLIDAVAGAGAAPRSVWSDVGTRNVVSLKAHKSCGFEIVTRYRCLHLFGRVLVRLEWPAVPAHGSSYEAGRRWLYTGRDYRRFVAEHLA
jgi:GNAT superfamily N-acetyltransferase